jgi:predicted lipoprotein with Yx(FWY)xxD motif
MRQSIAARARRAGFAAIVASCAAAAPAFAQAAPAAGPEPSQLSHPGNVALVQSEAGWTYVHFPTNLRLYVNDRDTPGSFGCDARCALAWPPLLAAADAGPVGDWTVVIRDNGSRQWAYKGRPVYVRYHDSPNAPTGDGVDGVWHFLLP